MIKSMIDEEENLETPSEETPSDDDNNTESDAEEEERLAREAKAKAEADAKLKVELSKKNKKFLNKNKVNVSVASNPAPVISVKKEPEPIEQSISSEEAVVQLETIKAVEETKKKTIDQFKKDDAGCPIELRDALDFKDKLNAQYKPFNKEWPEKDTYHIEQKTEYERLIKKQEKIIVELQRKYAQLI